MAVADEIIPLSLKDAPSFIETLLPVQRLSIDVYKERMAGAGQTLTALGSYWKGRKPLVLNRACILGALLPATSNPKLDLEVFEMLMGMDDESLRLRLQLKPGSSLPAEPYRTLSSKAKRAEELGDEINRHIWAKVNSHLHTKAASLQQLVEQLGIMRFGHRPIMADTFSGSGQIPFEAARLGCEVIATDLNPVACMLSWGALNVVAQSPEAREKSIETQANLLKKIRTEVDSIGAETDGNGWRGKAYLYCLEVVCPSSGWRVPLLPSLIISKPRTENASNVCINLIPNHKTKRYIIEVINNVPNEELKKYKTGTYQSQCLVHKIDGVEHRTKITTIRGDHTVNIDGAKSTKNKLRQWDKLDIIFRDDDIFTERLYAIQWIKKSGGSRAPYEFRSVTEDDLQREQVVISYVSKNLATWQEKGWIPDLKIEPGFNTSQPIWERGWTYWHHLFNPRQLMIFGLVRQYSDSVGFLALAHALNWNSRLSVWSGLDGGGGSVKNTFANQALNTVLNNGARGLVYCENLLSLISSYPQLKLGPTKVLNSLARDFDEKVDFFVTDPPYGDAVKYEEILEFFIAWLGKNPPPEFSNWVWDSRRTLAIKGEGHDFKLGMVAAYKRMTECMPENGLQIIMFTHQSGSIWADMANIVWASGLRVTAAWYVVTETDNALREGQYVKGTILLVLRKRSQILEAARDELAYELAEEVKTQVDLLTGLNKGVKDIYRDENLFEDADLQMAGYAAALRVLTRYSVIDGVSMPQESLRPRVKDQATMVDELIEFAVNIANEYLVPEGVDRAVWENCTGIERFYLKMLDMESKGIHVLSNYQNFAKAFKVQDYGAVMDEVKANHANLKSAAQLGKRGMTASEEFGPTVLRSVLYAVHLLQENKVKPEDVLHQLRDLVPDYFRKRERITALADYVSKKTAKARPDESSNALVLRDLVRRERV